MGQFLRFAAMILLVLIGLPAVVMASQRPASGHDAAINAGIATPAGARNT